MELVRSSRRPYKVIYPRTNLCVILGSHTEVVLCDYMFKPRTSRRPYELHELHELT
ncbi:hypothetical protein LCGC14_1322720 [marine sediment metagenome]|uniref:Uncharacterized protein n=1 Tax=marine sediment metagenome TaxID=412755 RepID=A0A0F9KJG9_9ZZZZ